MLPGRLTAAALDDDPLLAATAAAAGELVIVFFFSTGVTGEEFVSGEMSGVAVEGLLDRVERRDEEDEEVVLEDFFFLLLVRALLSRFSSSDMSDTCKRKNNVLEI